jgi:hypothetical protein
VISPGTTSVNYGGSQTFTITPSTGYSIASLTVDGSPVLVAPSYTFSSVQVAHTITATYSINTYVLTVNVGAHGQSNIASQKVNWGSVENFVFTPDAGYSVADVLVNGTIDEGAVSTLGITITGPTTVQVSFSINTFSLTVNVGVGGSSNVTSGNVDWGSTENFVFTPDDGYFVKDVIVNGTIDEGAVTSLSLTITGDTTVSVNFLISG